MRGLSWPPSGPLTPVDALEAGRADARRLLRPSSLAASDHRCLLTPPLAVATVVRERAVFLASSRHGPSIPPPWRASGAASVWLSPCRVSAQAGAEGGVSWREGSRNYSTRDTSPAAGASPPRPCTAWQHAAPRRRHADGWPG